MTSVAVDQVRGHNKGNTHLTKALAGLFSLELIKYRQLSPYEKKNICQNIPKGGKRKSIYALNSIHCDCRNGNYV